MKWQINDLIAAEQYWFERFCDRFGLRGKLTRQYPGVTSLLLTGPAGGIKQVDLDDQLLLDQMNPLEKTAAKELLESWLIFSIENTDPLAAADYSQTDRDYFSRVERLVPHCHIYTQLEDQPA